MPERGARARTPVPTAARSAGDRKTVEEIGTAVAEPPGSMTRTGITTGAHLGSRPTGTARAADHP
ncbi:hypothetical protein [Streptomyces sp. SLBN-8D4]|uniref:hypothetical protein n=1 Tax=Streptomyces sp. SLBN-8D4 TaxID=3377728 RepID=UPI003C797BC1